MIYYFRKTELKLKNLLISEDLKLDWEYTDKDDSKSATLLLNVYNLSDLTKKELKKGDIVEFGFGYENQVTPFFYGVIDKFGGETRGVTKVTTINCVSYTNDIKKKLSRSYIPGTTSSFIIKDMATLCNLEIELLELENDIVYKGGYNVYDLPLIALKKIANSCGSNISINGNKITISNGRTGVKRGIEFNYQTGLLAPLDYIQSSLLDDSEYGKEKKRKDYANVKATHKATTIAHPEVKKNDIIKVLGELYKVCGFTIRNWKFEGEIRKWTE